MSTERGSQPPPAPSEKAPALKSAANFSSFINKNTSGKKVAPKAARRRPGAAATTASTSKPPAATHTISSSEPRLEIPPSTVPAVPDPDPQTSQQLPTPLTTQEPATRVEGNTPATQFLATKSSTGSIPAIVAIESSPAPRSTSVAPVQDDEVESSPKITTPRSKTPRPFEDAPEEERSHKRQRIENPSKTETARQPKPGGKTSAPPTTTQDNSVTPQLVRPEDQPTIERTPEQTAHNVAQITPAIPDLSAVISAEASGSTDQQPGATETPESDVSPPTQQTLPRNGRRKLPWVTVNQPLNEQEVVVRTGTRTRPRPTAKARGKRKAPATTDDGEKGGGGVEQEDDEAAPKRPGARARGKRRATGATVDDDAGATETPPKKPRKTRKDKGTTRNKDGLEVEGQDGDGAAEEIARPKTKKKATKKNKKATRPGEPDAEGDGANGEDRETREIEKERRKRREREPTPSDAEHQEIEPEATLMTHLATRNIRVGKLSEREKKMREINWAEVKERRREEEAAAIDGGRASRTQVDEELARAGAAFAEATSQQSTGPKFNIVDGQIVLVQDSGNINREADADRMIELMEEVNEDDLTARITSRTYMRDNKRYPQDFMMPGQGTRWTKEGTDLFYDGLQMFGTDFDMISNMFPGTTRKSIKLKFNREERSNLGRVKEALAAPRNTDWDLYLQLSGRSNDAHGNVETIKADLARMEEETKVAVEAAKAAHEEEMRQRKLAGAELTDDEQDNGKRSKGRKGQGRKGAAHDDGGEVLGVVDEAFLDR
ncbi:hypothetical protein K504DRAFT_457346 [Pleomassaria siparia CBS 279.74]|uniref:Myb-like domain-containing protein n=1 Tax=Pleomassaria siparia CBS 279.74 TaxID=1314801 RepID=A0A6G1KQU5_9PLEO|nr:hypothetical protein K504DRAFT_457346 [Pleomassaria siparia CBS 279.74]